MHVYSEIFNLSTQYTATVPIVSFNLGEEVEEEGGGSDNLTSDQPATTAILDEDEMNKEDSGFIVLSCKELLLPGGMHKSEVGQLLFPITKMAGF
jgi:hypothetical protein